MVRKRGAKEQRRITRKCVARMYTLAHCRFRQFIVHKAKQLGAHLSCGECGIMHEVGGSVAFRCPACGRIADRDINAARNILGKFLHDNAS